MKSSGHVTAKRFLSGFVVARRLGCRVPGGLGPSAVLRDRARPRARGPAVDQRDRAQEFPSQGKLIMTTVRFRAVTAVRACCVAWLDPHQAVVSQDVLYPPGRPPSRRSSGRSRRWTRARSTPPTSSCADWPTTPRITATARSSSNRLRGARRRASSSPATSSSPSTARPCTPQTTPGGARRGAARATRHVRTCAPPARRTTSRSRGGSACPDVDEPRLGINLIDPFPFDVRIASGDVGGPSAGLCGPSVSTTC